MKNGPFFLETDNGTIYCFFSCSKRPMQKKKCIVFCSPHAEEKLISHRVLYNQALDLSNKGYDCLRFDHYGHGESDGDFSDLCVESMKIDIQAIISLLKENGYLSICLVGYRLGGTLSTLVASEDQRVNELILINPIMDVNNYIKNCLRENILAQRFIHNKILYDTNALIKNILLGKKVCFSGYEMTEKFIESSNNIDMRELLEKCECNILFIEVIKGKKQQCEDIENGPHIKYQCIQGVQCWGNHKPYKDKIIVKEIDSWLKGV